MLYIFCIVFKDTKHIIENTTDLKINEKIIKIVFVDLNYFFHFNLQYTYNLEVDQLRPRAENREHIYIQAKSIIYDTPISNLKLMFRI